MEGKAVECSITGSKVLKEDEGPAYVFQSRTLNFDIIKIYLGHVLKISIFNRLLLFSLQSS